MHAVQRLFLYRKSLSTKPFKARGHKVDRCPQCQIDQQYCICSYRPVVSSNAAFLLLMYDSEVLKPSNTGRLIADLIPDTHAFLWSRKEPDEKMLNLLASTEYQPYVVFPECYADKEQSVVNDFAKLQADKKPLFVILDGTWREAKKMFRKSPYLNKFPLLSFTPEQLAHCHSRYHVRTSENPEQLATAEVAARVLGVYGEEDNAHLLDLWFDVFSYHYQQGVKQVNKGCSDALARLEQVVKTNN